MEAVSDETSQQENPGQSSLGISKKEKVLTKTATLSNRPKEAISLGLDWLKLC